MAGAKRELDALSLSSPSPLTGPQATCRSFRADIVGRPARYKLRPRTWNQARPPNLKQSSPVLTECKG
jgi:hypothetical protein